MDSWKKFVIEPNENSHAILSKPNRLKPVTQEQRTGDPQTGVRR